MADNALLASLLMGQRRKADPVEGRRKYGENLIVQGSSMAPVQSPLEGLARALQAGVGGYFAGAAEREEEARDKRTVAGLSSAFQAKTPEEAVKFIQDAGGDPQIVAPMLGSMLTGKWDRQQKNALATEAATNFGATYGVMPGATGQPTPLGSGPPLPTGQPTAGGFNNNLGNIRASNANWDGKGAPQNGFETFNTPQQGANAMFGNLGAYVKAQPNITVAQAIQKWAPPNENDTNLYIRQVMESTGINPGMPLAEVMQDPAVAATLMDAMTRKEKGGLPQGVTADTFMNATTPGGQPQSLTVNMPQGSADGSGNAVPPVAQAPAPPNVPRPQPAPQQIQRYQQMIASGQMTPQQAEKALSDDLDRQWSVDRENANRRYDASVRAFEYDRNRGDKQTDRALDKADKAPQQAFDNANKLRDEFQASPVVKNYREITPIMESMKDAMQRPSRAADLNMVYALAKIMDPGSVVREGEMVMVNNTQGIGDRLAGMINSLNGGATLTPDARKRILEEAQSRYKGLEQNYQTLEGHYGEMADRFKLRREDVIVPIRKQAAGNTAVTSPEDLKKKYGLE